MSSAHIFYIPVLILVGIFAGYFLGRRALENELREARRRRERREALKNSIGDARDEET